MASAHYRRQGVHGESDVRVGLGGGPGDARSRVGRRASGGRGWRVLPRARVVEIQRSRLLAAAVRVVDELGYADATVADITAGARVSRRTFYELFENREACMVALLEEAVGQVEGELAAANLGGLPWRERVRGGLGAILSFLDREPALARVCLVQTLRGGPVVLERRERVLARLAAVVDEGRMESASAAGCSALSAEGVVGAAFMIIYGRLLRESTRPLSGLLGELCGLIVLPYLGPAVARREQARPGPGSLQSSTRGGEHAAPVGSDPLAGVSMRLTYRTARVLEGVALYPNTNNRELAEHAGIQDAGQISKLLARLERLGLLENQGGGQANGEPNAWALSPLGQQVTHSLLLHGPTTSKGAPNNRNTGIQERTR